MLDKDMIELAAKIFGCANTENEVRKALNEYRKETRERTPKVDVIDANDPALDRIEQSGAIVIDLANATPQEIPTDALGEDPPGRFFVHKRQVCGTVPVYYELGWRNAGCPSDANIGVAGRYVGV